MEFWKVSNRIIKAIAVIINTNKKFKKDIVDRKRITQILKNISVKSKNKHIDPKITNKIWKAMIKAFIEYEFRNFKKKR